MTIRLAILFLIGMTVTASADERSRDGASREYLVTDDGGAFEVPVHKDFVTVLYFPDQVKKALGSDQKNFSITVMDDTVALRPRTADANITANLNITTESLRVSVILKVADAPSEAVSQVVFKKAELEQEIQRRVDEQVRARLTTMEAEHDRRMKELDREVRARAEQEIASRLLERVELLELNGIDRNDDNVIVRVKRAAIVGQAAYVYFDIQNRDDASYRLAEARLTDADGAEVGGMVVFATSAGTGDGIIGLVPGGQRRLGIVMIPAADAARGRSLTLRVAEPDGRRAVTVGGVRIR